jgi:hypothetical protein
MTSITLKSASGIVGGLLVALLFPCLVHPAQGSCANADFAAATFIAKWNERVKTDKLDSSWQVENYNGLGFIRHNLGGARLLLTAQVDKAGCITEVHIKSRRADAEAKGLAALVAWSSIIIVTNPSLPKEQRKNVFESLKLDQPVAGGSYTVNHVTYAYTENTEINDFSAKPD